MTSFAAAGAEGTVTDYSSEQIESERRVLSREGYDTSIIQGGLVCVQAY